MARNLVRFNPFAELSELEKQFFEDGALAPFRGLRFPTTDVYTEDDKQLTMKVQLPGFQEKDISVDLDQNTLVVQAERHETEEDKKRKYVLRESRDSYYRRVALPEQADAAGITAAFRDGVLTVTVPFKETPVPKKIEITGGA